MNKAAVAAASGTVVAGSSAGAYALGAFDGLLSKSPSDVVDALWMAKQDLSQFIKEKNYGDGCVSSSSIFSSIDTSIFNHTTQPLTNININFTSNTANSCFIALVKKKESEASDTNSTTHFFLWALKRGDKDGFVATSTIDETKKTSNSTLYLLEKKGENNSWVVTQKGSHTNNNISGNIPVLSNNLLNGGANSPVTPNTSANTVVYGRWGEIGDSGDEITK